MRGQAGGGAIVNLTSGAALGIPNRAVYGATKGAMLSYTVNLAGDLAPHGIRVNALAPLAATRMTDPALDERDHGAQAGEFEGIPAAEAIAPVIAWLLSDAAAGVTGRTVRFTGRQLSLVAPAALASPVLERDDWSAAELDRALAAITAE
jgi:NAD(P)-dependent dehydrogenase (short-subunit alcohol dehydrogenase family)